MGLFDRIKLQHEIARRLPGFAARSLGPAPNEVSWQTKDIDRPCMDNYRITREGHLEKELRETTETPKDERPYPDADPEDEPFKAMAGTLTHEHVGWDRIEYHGEIRLFQSFGALDRDDVELLGGDPDEHTPNPNVSVVTGNDDGGRVTGPEPGYRVGVEYVATFTHGVLEKIECTRGTEAMIGQVEHFDFAEDTVPEPEPEPEKTKTVITLTPSETGGFAITDAETGVSTYGETKLEAILMLADALAAYHGADPDADDELALSSEELLELAHDVFGPGEWDVVSPDTFLDAGGESDPLELDEPDRDGDVYDGDTDTFATTPKAPNHFRETFQHESDGDGDGDGDDEGESSGDYDLFEGGDGHGPDRGD